MQRLFLQTAQGVGNITILLIFLILICVVFYVAKNREKNNTLQQKDSDVKNKKIWDRCKNIILSNKRYWIVTVLVLLLGSVSIAWENSRVDDIREDFYQEGYGDGNKDGYKKGYEEGYSQGVSDGTHSGQRSGYYRGYHDAQIHTKPCMHCRGRGVNTCFHCQSAGCGMCSNTGLEKCNTCDGRGWNQY